MVFNSMLDKINSLKYFYWKKDFKLESGSTLPGFQLAYETYGNLNPPRTNVILIFHALSGSSHVYKDESEIGGWWDEMVGVGKPFDPSKYYIICVNILGGCYGSTGPSSINPETKKPFGLSFPIITVHDIIRSIKLLIDHLNIESILAVTGGSLGGFQTLDWAVSFPNITQSVIPIATASYATTFNIAFNEVQRQAIFSDPNWNNGNYYDGEPPNVGLRLAREIGHITYLSEASMKEKFGRDLRYNPEYEFQFKEEFEVESYLQYKGTSFTKRFDANSYLYITKTIDYFDLRKDGNLSTMFLRLKDIKFLVISFSSDWLYPTSQSREIVYALKSNGIETSFVEIKTSYGHDSFLVRCADLRIVVANFLKNLNLQGKK
ncbi:MAG: Homoserine O-acetyltransferase [Candidatus Lokiarchaeum sp. GC14_75]|nr:MAG: Homoserine O-acetyltransferase [Candidatus Lokiarchaeum sp. GC14_75]